MFALIARRRFGPLFATQFLGAFNDNLYKTAMVMLITFRLLADDLQAGAIMVTLAGGVFILPFFLFSSLAGQLADARDKAWLIRIIKAAEILIMCVGALALHRDSVALLMLVLFAMGVHSTFFGPIKYAILPQHLDRSEVLGGTGLVEAGTFIAILAGQILGGLLPPDRAAIAVVLVALAGFIAGRQVPPALPQGEAAPIRLNVLAASVALVREIAADRRLMRAVLAISWFWALGAVLTSQFVPLVKGALHAGEGVATLFLTMFSIGIALGSVSVNRLLKGEVSTRFAPAAAVMVSLFLADLYFAVGAFDAPDAAAPLLDARAFLGHADAPRLLIDLLGMATAAGVFVVPLYALLQTASDVSARARVIAANNIVNSGFMVAAAVGSAALIGAGLEVRHVLLVVAAVNLGGAWLGRER